MFDFSSIYFDDQPREGRILDIFHAQQPLRETALFFIHGGGWKAGSRTIFHSIIQEYSRLGFDCASTDYRLGGVDVFQQIGDVRTGLDIFAADLEKRNRPTKIVLIGSSAGAHLALLTGFTTPEVCGAPETSLSCAPKIAGIAVQAAPFTFEPWPDIFPGVWDAMQTAIGVPYAGNEELFRLASPMNTIRAGMPPLLIQHAENELMFPRELHQRFAVKSTALGNNVREIFYPRVEHGFFYSLERPQQRAAFDDILEFATNVDR